MSRRLPRRARRPAAARAGARSWSARPRPHAVLVALARVHLSTAQDVEWDGGQVFERGTEAAVEAGDGLGMRRAEVFHPLGDTFWGERFGQIIDPFGHRWGMATHLRDVPADEVARAAAEMFGS